MKHTVHWKISRGQPDCHGVEPGDVLVLENPGQSSYHPRMKHGQLENPPDLPSGNLT